MVDLSCILQTSFPLALEHFDEPSGVICFSFDDEKIGLIMKRCRFHRRPVALKRCTSLDLGSCNGKVRRE